MAPKKSNPPSNSTIEQNSSSEQQKSRPKPRPAASSSNKSKGKAKASNSTSTYLLDQSKDQDDSDEQENEEQREENNDEEEEEEDEEEESTLPNLPKNKMKNNTKSRSNSKPKRKVDPNLNLSTSPSPTQSDQESDQDQVDDDEDVELSSPSSDDDNEGDDGETTPRGKSKGKGKRKLPSESERLRKWRKLSGEERENLIGEGGIVWATARSLLYSNPLNKPQAQEIRSLLQRTLSKMDVTLEKTLIPPTSTVVGGGAAIPSTNIDGNNELGMISGSERERGLNGIMRGWIPKGIQIEEEDQEEDVNSEDNLHEYLQDIDQLESLLLPEASQALTLSRALATQESALESSKRYEKIRKEKKLAEKEKERQRGGKNLVELDSRFFD